MLQLTAPRKFSVHRADGGVQAKASTLLELRRQNWESKEAKVGRVCRAEDQGENSGAPLRVTHQNPVYRPVHVCEETAKSSGEATQEN